MKCTAWVIGLNPIKKFQYVPEVAIGATGLQLMQPPLLTLKKSAVLHVPRLSEIAIRRNDNRRVDIRRNADR